MPDLFIWLCFKFLHCHLLFLLCIFVEEHKLYLVKVYTLMWSSRVENGYANDIEVHWVYRLLICLLFLGKFLVANSL